MKIGIQINAFGAPAILEQIRQADELGIDCVWLTSGGAQPDPLTVFAAAATQTARINFGSAIIQTFPRHPLALVQQAIAIDQLAPGRLRLGVGPSGPLMARTFGIPFERPQEHLREYVRVLRAQLHDGEVDFDGRRISAHLKGPKTGVLVMASALREKAFALCGEVADGAISWVSPLAYLRDAALPALADAATRAGRPRPLLIAHVLVAVTPDPEAARAAVRATLGFFATIPTYQAMFADAGYPEATEGAWSDAMIDAVTVHGDVASVERQLRGLRDYGFDEIMASVLPIAGNDAAAGQGLRILGRVASHP